MTGDPTQCPTDGGCSSCKPMTRALAWSGIAVAALLPALFSVLPATAQPWNLSVIGALALFVAARLNFTQAFLFTLYAIIAKDCSIYLVRGESWAPHPLSWVFFLGYVGIGWAFLRRTDSPVKIGAAALSASLLFFVVSNFASWLEQSLPYGYSLAGLADCFAAGVPFYRGTLIGDLAFTGVLFGAHAMLSAVYFPAERVVPVQITNDRREE